MVSSSQSTYSKKLLPLISWSHWFTFFNIVATVLLSSFYIFTETAPDTFIGYIYLITTWISHMGFLTFMSFVLIIFPIILIFPRTTVIRIVSSVIFTLGLLLLLLDALVYNKLGYHLNASSSDQIISLISGIIERDYRLFWFTTILLTLGILSFQLVVSNYAWKHLRSLQKSGFAKYFVASVVMFFISSHSIHIWADANLEYDVLKQDTTLPLSYPTTAKALLTKYELFDRADYMQRRTSPLSFTNKTPLYPQISDLVSVPDLAICTSGSRVKNSTFVILTNNKMTTEQQQHFSNRSSETNWRLSQHIDNALPVNSWFNLLYSVPSIYKESIDEQQIKPVLFQLIEQKQLATTYTRIRKTPENIGNEVIDFSYQWLFEQTTELSDISTLVFAKKLNSYPIGIHVLYFDDVNNYQFELFMDALLLAQKQKKAKDVIWVSSIGNNTDIDALTTKPALFISPGTKSKQVNHLTSHMDVQTSIINHWLKCDNSELNFGNGKNLSKIKNDRIIANTMSNGIVVFNKDKSVMIDQNSNFQSYSSQLNAPIMVDADFPLMIDGVNFIKKFNQQAMATAEKK